MTRSRKANRFSNRQSLKKILKEMPAEVRETAEGAVEKGGDDIVGTMKVIVPVVKGNLKRTIRWKWTSNSYRISIRILAGGDHGGVEVPYAKITEYQHGSAFFNPAVRAQRRRVKARISRAVTTATKRVVARNKKGDR